MKVMIADDEHLVRYSLRSMIEELDLGLTVVAEASDSESMLAALARFQPELCFVDIRMPGLGGLAAIRKARKAGSSARWIILTSHAEFEYASEALQLGVAAYLLKPAGLSQLAEVLVPLLKGAERQRREDSVRFEHALVAALGSPGSQVSVPPSVSAAWLVCLQCDVGAACTPQERSDFPGETLAHVRALAPSFLAGSLVTAAWISSPGRILVAAGWEAADTEARAAAAQFKEAIGILVKQSAVGSRWVTGFSVDSLNSWVALRSALADIERVVPHRITMGTAVFHTLGALQRRIEGLSEALAALPEQVEAFIQTRGRGEIPALEAHALALRDGFIAAGPAVAALEAAARFLAFCTGLEAPAGAAGARGLVTWAEDLVTASRVARASPGRRFSGAGGRKGRPVPSAEPEERDPRARHCVRVVPESQLFVDGVPPVDAKHHQRASGGSSFGSVPGADGPAQQPGQRSRCRGRLQKYPALCPVVPQKIRHLSLGTLRRS